MNYDPLQQFAHAEHRIPSESTVLLSAVERGAATDLFKSANTVYLPETTQQMRWQLPDERRLHVVRGGLRRDWRAGAQVMGGLLLITLMVLTLSRWPAHARPAALSKPLTAPPAATVTANSSLSVPYATANGRLWTPSAYRPGFQHYRSVSEYRPRRRPIPGLPDAYLSQSTRSGGANTLDNGYYTVPPAAPTGIGPAVPHYSY